MKNAAIFLAIFMTIFLSTSSQAQVMCGDWKEMTTALKAKFEESPVSKGLTATGSLVEVYASKKGSWTIVVTSPKGQSCLVAAGEYWESLPKIVNGESL